MGLPAGTLTFLLTDIVGSTVHLHGMGDGFAAPLSEHFDLLRRSLGRHGGSEVTTTGDGLLATFVRPSDAVSAAIAMQRAMVRHQWTTRPLEIRIGLHSGEAALSGDVYPGTAVHRAARIMALAAGGQILISSETGAVAVATGGVCEWKLRELGRFDLKGFDH